MKSYSRGQSSHCLSLFRAACNRSKRFGDILSSRDQAAIISLLKSQRNQCQLVSRSYVIVLVALDMYSGKR